MALWRFCGVLSGFGTSSSANLGSIAIRILVSYTTAGAGHRRAAEAVADALRARDQSADVQCVDVLTFVPSVIRRGYPGVYYFLVRRASVMWGLAFEWLDHRWVSWLVQPFRRAWNLVVGRRFLAWLRHQDFDAVVATHFLPADLFAAARRAGWLRARSVVVITDFHPHWLWVHSRGDVVVVASAHTAAECEARGIPRSNLRIIGIPTARAFHESVNRPELLRRLNLDGARRTVLVTSGVTTVGPFDAVVEHLLRLETVRPGRLQLLVVCGEDQRAVRRLEARARAAGMPARVFGFVENMPELMGVSDVVVAKAGGLTVMEALAEGLPLIVYHAIPGQERWNARYLVRHGAAIAAETPGDVAACLLAYVDDPRRLDALRVTAKNMGRPDAAEAIAAEVIGALTAAGGAGHGPA